MTALEPRDLRTQILATAGELFIQRGYRGLAMREIAEALGVTKAALYYHFKDKEELFLAILDGYLAEIERLVDAVVQRDQGARSRIHGLVQDILAQPPEQRAMIRLFSQEMSQLNEAVRVRFNLSYHQKFIDKIEAILRAGMASGELKPLDPSVAAWALLGMMYPYFYPAHGKEAAMPDRLVDQIVTIYLDGIGAT